MHLTISRWGNSLAVRIPSEVVRKLAIEEGNEMECSLMQDGTLKLTPLSQEARKKWLQEHFSRVAERVFNEKETTPSSELLRGEAQY